jgi:hypothetical protein
LQLTLIGERSELKVRYQLYCNIADFLSDCCFSVNVTSFSLVDLRYLELVRRGEEADRISTLPGAKGIAARKIEDERCAEWDRAFTAVQAKSQPQSLQLLSAAAVSQVQSTSSSHSSTYRLQGSESSQAHKRGFLKFSTWLRRGKASTS